MGSSSGRRAASLTLGVARVLTPKTKLAAKMLKADSIKRAVINATPPLVIEFHSATSKSRRKRPLLRFAGTSSYRSALPRVPSLRNSVHFRRNVSQLKNNSLIAPNTGGWGTPHILCIRDRRFNSTTELTVRGVG